MAPNVQPLKCYLIHTRRRRQRPPKPAAFDRKITAMAAAFFLLNTAASPLFRPNPLPPIPRPPNIHSLSSSSSTPGSGSALAIGSGDGYLVADEVEGGSYTMTGGAYDFKRATSPLTYEVLSAPKKVTLLRHGLSSWNDESRIQGSSNLSVLTDTGAMQAERCRLALSNLNFDQCFSSPISRAKSTAEILWQGRQPPLVFLDTLKEAHLYFLEGMTNADATKKYPELYKSWREDPANFHVNGIYPIRKLWGTATKAWREILSTPGENFLVVTHKSILRALLCTALGLGPERFRAVDVNNGGISVFTFNIRGEAMLLSLNMTAHMYSDHIYQY